MRFLQSKLSFLNLRIITPINALINQSKRIISYQSKVNNKLIEAISNCKIDKINQILEHDDPTLDNNLAIRTAAALGNLLIVKKLLNHPEVDPGANNSEALWACAYGKHFDVVRALLIDNRVDPSINDNAVIRLAASDGHLDIVRMLMADPRVDASDCNNEAIRFAVKHHNYEIVKELMADPRVNLYAAVFQKKLFNYVSKSADGHPSIKR
jgi:hypothetical protein